MGLTSYDLQKLGPAARNAVHEQLKKSPRSTKKREPVGEATFAAQLDRAGFYYERQVQILKTRKWRVDFLFRVGDDFLCIDLHGQVHGQRGDGLNDPKPGKRSKDYEKANVIGWLPGHTYWIFSSQQVGSGVALASVIAWLTTGNVPAALQGVGATEALRSLYARSDGVSPETKGTGRVAGRSAATGSVSE